MTKPIGAPPHDPEGHAQETALIPTPATTTGTWTWTEQRADTTTRLPILTPDPHDLPTATPEIRSGFLTLEGATAYTRATD
ncbi:MULTISPECIES: hypothetical protein [Streptomycetaceae]|uniref:Uncharacterized protein n=1 Tax=Streptantibioticus cattleyicolor (strain ATCC 35852 / DSM 46488 / JCM 4925 / NBRC 14057 / NRRL 8057) TaxID=1003195 RepID=F8JS57_STREN|nr:MULTISPECIES: hypothetical protein [Streptomycetaceae]AEW94165.1 hypothetical protein SCATT_17940 [Streptantibioticus cattleyicolor NRRL 8057 = DSM 46488]MYS58830.1 hypothetical protein [Streptomyces sp. SID5468]CCB74521.1 protein of unknown function [Streptantibioticus cattleyicolor NRRL 8057 = DSM 46488]